MKARHFADILMLLCLVSLALSVSLPFGAQCSTGGADDAIKDLLGHKPDKRHAAVEVLGRIRDPESISALISVLDDANEDWLLRKKIILLFREIREPRAVSSMVDALQDPCPAIRWSAAGALSEFPGSNLVISHLIYTLEDRVLFVREAAIMSLGRLKADRALPFIISALEDKSFAIRCAAINALGRIGPANAVGQLRRISANDPDELIRSEAIKALKGIF
ncbi:MAG: HEAT repeat domain-containing protein [Deltaproteobacteria bacterium]|nr:HEAT repeat domain-containing protein [Deltaproteobacteria bacterium]